MTALAPTDSDKPFRGRRMSWGEFERILADNDNSQPGQPLSDETLAHPTAQPHNGEPLVRAVPAR